MHSYNAKKQTIHFGRGFEGMKAADQILKKHGEPGMLIGGLSREIWSGATKQSLGRHKDVDVLATSFTFRPDRFEGGIDWFLPQELSCPLSDRLKWHENSIGGQLSFQVDLSQLPKLAPGLFIPSPDLVVRMRLAEENIQNPHLFATLYRAMKEKMQLLPKFISDNFALLDGWLPDVKALTPVDRDRIMLFRTSSRFKDGIPLQYAVESFDKLLQ